MGIAITIIIIGVVLYLIFKPKENARSIKTPSIPSEVLDACRDMYKDLSLKQKYSIYNFLDGLAQVAAQTTSAKNKITPQVHMTAQYLNISPASADNFLNQNGIEDMAKTIGTLPKGAVLDSTIATAFGIVMSAEGRLPDGRSAKDFAMTVFQGTLEIAGFTEEEIEASLNKTAAFMSAINV